jgi:nitroimidazol reductase NimA-like FMN-containing flavoprotein (pyridoxamine 5'-phosphate oxidase superfamily)
MTRFLLTTPDIHKESTTMGKSEQFRIGLKKLFNSQALASLSTHHAGQPYASLVAFYASDDLKYIYFVTPKTTRKYGNLTANSRVAVMVNNSTNNVSDFHRAISVTAVGKAEEISESEKEPVLIQYLTKHPHLEDFARSPTCALIGVAVETYYMVKNFQNVTELHLEP